MAVSDSFVPFRMSSETLKSIENASVSMLIFITSFLCVSLILNPFLNFFVKLFIIY